MLSDALRSDGNLSQWPAALIVGHLGPQSVLVFSSPRVRKTGVSTPMPEYDPERPPDLLRVAHRSSGRKTTNSMTETIPFTWLGGTQASSQNPHGKPLAWRASLGKAPLNRTLGGLVHSANPCSRFRSW